MGARLRWVAVALTRGLTDLPIGMGLFVSSLTFTTFLWLDLPLSPRWIAASGLIFFALYGVNRLTDLAEDTLTQPDRAAFVARRWWTLAGAFAAAFVAGGALAWTAGISVAALAPCALAVPVYSAPWLPGGRRLKDLTLAKSLFAGFFLVYGSAGLVVAYAPDGAPGAAPMLAFVYARVVMNTVLCDVPDAPGDRALGVMTVPARFGVARTLAVLQAANLAVTLVAAAAWWGEPVPIAVIAGAAVAAEAVLAAARRGLVGVALKTAADLEVVAWAVYGGVAWGWTSGG